MSFVFITGTARCPACLTRYTAIVPLGSGNKSGCAGMNETSRLGGGASQRWRSQRTKTPHDVGSSARTGERGASTGHNVKSDILVVYYTT